jgi:hypothetical protein
MIVFVEMNGCRVLNPRIVALYHPVRNVHMLMTVHDSRVIMLIECFLFFKPGPDRRRTTAPFLL